MGCKCLWAPLSTNAYVFRWYRLIYLSPSWANLLSQNVSKKSCSRINEAAQTTASSAHTRKILEGALHLLIVLFYIYPFILHFTQHEPFRSAPNYTIDTVLELTRRSATGKCE